MFGTLLTIIKRDLTLAMRRRTDIFTTLFFFVIVVSLFPLGIGPEMDTLRMIAPLRSAKPIRCALEQM